MKIISLSIKKHWLALMVALALPVLIPTANATQERDEKLTVAAKDKEVLGDRALSKTGVAVNPKIKSENKFLTPSDALERHPVGKIRFSLPFFANPAAVCTKYPEICLADSIPDCNLNVVLLSKQQICSAVTLFRFMFEGPAGGPEFEATALDVSGKCRNLAVAVLGGNAEEVRIIPLTEEQSPAPRDMEGKARQLLKDWTTTSTKADEFGDISQNPLLDSSPKLFKAGHITMLQFAVDKEGGENGPVVLSLNGQLFRLDGWCTEGHLFFEVKKKLHVSYRLRCCGCGLENLQVYDLSGQTPEKVYENEKIIGLGFHAFTKRVCVIEYALCIRNELVAAGLRAGQIDKSESMPTKTQIKFMGWQVSTALCS